jgi:hypothetical protein
MGVPIPPDSDSVIFESESSESGSVSQSDASMPGFVTGPNLVQANSVAQHADRSTSEPLSMDGAESGETRPRLIRTDSRYDSILEEPGPAESAASHESTQRQPQRQPPAILTRRSNTLSHPVQPIIPNVGRTQSIPTFGRRPVLATAASDPVYGHGDAQSAGDWIFHGHSRSEPNDIEPDPDINTNRRASGPAFSRPYHQVIHSGRIRA